MHRKPGCNAFERVLEEGIVTGIIRRLTDKQREAILWLNVDGTRRARSGKDAPAETSLMCLSTFKLMPGVVAALAGGDVPAIENGRWGERQWRLLPLGLKVRAQLDRASPRPAVSTVAPKRAARLTRDAA